MPRVSHAEFARIKKAAADKKARRLENADFNAKIGALSGRAALQDAPGRTKKKKGGPSARNRAFARLKANRDMFVRVRAKYRTGGTCEVGIVCRGQGAIECVYHVFPAAMGNAIKHDPRNLLGACSSCNGGEYFARKRGSDQYLIRHREILGAALFEELKASQGRKKISTVEANELADEYARMIERGDWLTEKPVDKIFNEI